MISALIIRLLTPVIVEVIRELLFKLANGELVSIDEASVKTAMMQREAQVQSQLKAMGFDGGGL
ncbi:hypothetical protein UFOVP184_45 [uncultured Caudovirales phage]|uniref:Uncharacterized protein n=1 Tax=uncultured Caudovirales phage TaxID=2100421 RepID=A0A6J7WK76_9CAUD|nr:hypothetical protein UFOVP184_45 [uncultured Caudovirales phage]